MTPSRRYAQAQNETASPERLMVLLFEAALRHIRRGAAALEAGRPSEANAPLAKATDIVNELSRTFDPARHPKLAQSLGQIYEFVCVRLLSANLRRDPTLAREAERALAPVAEAFAAAVGQLQAERADAEAR